MTRLLGPWESGPTWLAISIPIAMALACVGCSPSGDPPPYRVVQLIDGSCDVQEHLLYGWVEARGPEICDRAIAFAKTQAAEDQPPVKQVWP